MFDVVVAASPRTPFHERVISCLRAARLRVIACEMGPADRAPSVFRVDVAVACSSTGPGVGSLASGIRASLDGPPPVVGVSGSLASPPTGLADFLPADIPASMLTARVQRAAGMNERRRSRVFLAGELADVGAKDLLASLAARRKTCVVKIKAEDRHAEIALEDGTVVHARADGSAHSSAHAVLAAIETWPAATFEVHGDASPASRVDAVRESPTLRPPLPADAADVALAAAVMNAVASYARSFLPSAAVADHLERSREAARAVDPGVRSFVVSPDGVVSVSSVAGARGALPEALTAWCMGFFDECARAMPLRFQRSRVADVLGGLTRMIEQVGWGTTLLPREGNR